MTPSSSPPPGPPAAGAGTAAEKKGERLVIPIGPVGSVQTLWLFEKQNGELTATNLGAVSFVPLTGVEK